VAIWQLIPNPYPQEKGSNGLDAEEMNKNNKKLNKQK